MVMPPRWTSSNLPFWRTRVSSGVSNRLRITLIWSVFIMDSWRIVERQTLPLLSRQEAELRQGYNERVILRRSRHQGRSLLVTAVRDPRELDRPRTWTRACGPWELPSWLPSPPGCAHVCLLRHAAEPSPAHLWRPVVVGLSRLRYERMSDDSEFFRFIGYGQKTPIPSRTSYSRLHHLPHRPGSIPSPTRAGAQRHRPRHPRPMSAKP